MGILKRIYHGIIVGHPLPSGVNEGNIEENLGKVFVCDCNERLRIKRGLIMDYTVESI